MKIKLKVGQKVRFRSGDTGEVVGFRKDYASDPQPFRACNNKTEECWYYTEDGKWDPDVEKCEDDIVEILEEPKGEKMEQAKITEKDVGREYIGRDGETYKIFNFTSGSVRPVTAGKEGAELVYLTDCGIYSLCSESGVDFMRWADEGEKMGKLKLTEKDVWRQYIARNGAVYTITKYNKDDKYQFIIDGAFGSGSINAQGFELEGCKKPLDFVRWVSEKADDETTDEAPKGKYSGFIEWDEGGHSLDETFQGATFEQVRDKVADLLTLTEDDWGAVEMLDNARKGTAVEFKKDFHIAGAKIGTLTVKVRLN